MDFSYLLSFNFFSYIGIFFIFYQFVLNLFTTLIFFSSDYNYVRASEKRLKKYLIQDTIGTKAMASLICKMHNDYVLINLLLSCNLGTVAVRAKSVVFFKYIELILPAQNIGHRYPKDGLHKNTKLNMTLSHFDDMPYSPVQTFASSI